MDTPITCLLLVIISCCGVQSAFDGNIPGPKYWWTKRITPELYTAGRLTDTQLKQALDSGFKTIITQTNFMAKGKVNNEVNPATTVEKQITKDFGAAHDFLLDLANEWKSEKAVEELAGKIDSNEKPILLHCNDTYTSTFLALSYLLKQSTTYKDFRPQVDSDTFYRKAAAMGHNYDQADLKNLVSRLSNQPTPRKVPAPEGDPTREWLDNGLWVIKPVHGKWYVSGQIRKTYIPALGKSNFDAVVNVRLGVTSPPNNQSSQEEVTLLNIKDGTGTYNSDGTAWRQTTERLRDTRIDRDRPTTFINATSPVNYQSRNRNEFGDDVGYNEEAEKNYIKDELNITYVHTPFKRGEYGDIVNKYERDWQEVGDKHKKILVHSHGGFRAMIVALIAAGKESKNDYHWALEKAKDLGYDFEAAGENDVVTLLQKALPDYSGARACGPTMWLLLPAIVVGAMRKLM